MPTGMSLPSFGSAMSRAVTSRQRPPHFNRTGQMRTSLATFAVITLCAACSAPAPQPGSNTAVSDAAAHQAHDAYVTAINSNDLDSLLGMLTDDVVFLSANEPVMVVRPRSSRGSRVISRRSRRAGISRFRSSSSAATGPLSATHTNQPTRLWPAVPSWRALAGVS